MLNKEEQTRYLRQVLLDQFGDDAQLKLKRSKVLVVGAGGLGGPLLVYLVAAGIGEIIVCDSDTVELSNLNRQILHSTNDLERTKADSALETLSALNPNVKLECKKVHVDESNISELADGVDIIADCLDNVKTRYVLNDYCMSKGIPLMHAGIDGWNGQLTLISSPETPCINCLFETYEEGSGPKPVLGAMAGVMGAMQALETIKFLIGKPTLKNHLLYFDSLNSEWNKLPIHKNDDCSVCSTK